MSRPEQGVGVGADPVAARRAGPWKPGDEVGRLVRTMTAERMEWYVAALDTAVRDDGRRVLPDVNIHTDDGLARASGLAARIADGMISTNWLQTVLHDAFGDAFLAGGSLRTRYLRPVFVGDRIEAVARVREVTPAPDGGVLVHCEVWCDNQHGERCTAGEATVPLLPGRHNVADR